MALSREQRQYLNWVESTDTWQSINKADLKSKVTALLDRFPMPEAAMAQFILEFSTRVRQAVTESEKEDASLHQEVVMLIAELDVTAAAITRKIRGKVPL